MPVSLEGIHRPMYVGSAGNDSCDGVISAGPRVRVCAIVLRSGQLGNGIQVSLLDAVPVATGGSRNV